MKRLILGLLAVFAVYTAGAQAYLNDPKYGATQEERTENAKLYSSFRYSVNLQDWAQAEKELKQLLESAPKISENIYINGIKIYDAKLAACKTDDEKKAVVADILALFDKRCEHFANHPSRGKTYILGQKARKYSQLCPDDRQTLYGFFVEAIESDPAHLDKELVQMYFANVTESFKFDDINLDEFMTRYDALAKLLKSSTDPNAAELTASVDAAFASSGAASCENIERIFRPKFEADPTNNDLLKQILGLFNHSHCQNPWQMDLLEKYYENDPQPEFALMLAGVYEDRKDYAKALEYIEVAIKNETDPKEKVKHMLRAAGQTLAMDKWSDAAKYSRQILDIDPENGMASNFYASAIAGAVNSGCSGFDKQAAYWLVVDYYVKAKKNIPEDDPQVESINKAIAVYSGNFPKKDELFMRGLEDGQSYSVSCGWVSGQTVVRGRK